MSPFPKLVDQKMHSNNKTSHCITSAFSALTLLVGWQEEHPACKKIEWWGAGVVVCLERGADLHMAQLMPLPLTVSCFTKIQIGFTFLVPTNLGSPGKMAVKRVCVCVCSLHNIPIRVSYTDSLLYAPRGTRISTVLAIWVGQKMTGIAYEIW